MSAKKNDSGKLRVSLVPMDALEEVIKAFEFGAKKYDDDNWRKGMKHSRFLDATFRHVYLQYKQGEDLDDESGLNHLAHGIADLLMLLSSKMNGYGEDDRG